ncbi:MAG: hypothetical protein [Caudoviricetes sp.]|nr:MAG: hypothetical protein [Caudoviricetes sp.]
MARQEIDLTTPQPNGKMGEPTKAAWNKVNEMTAEIYASPGMNGSLMGRNMLINCGIPINQRGFSGGALSAGAYGYDRWKAGSGGCNVSINSSGVFSHVSGNLVQVIEQPALAWGRALTFSVEDPSGTINVSIGGTAGVITPGSGRKSVTVTPSGSGDLTLQISATGVTYVRPQLERGPVPSVFDCVDRSVEISKCQRYFEKSYNIATAPGSVSTDPGKSIILATALNSAVHAFGNSVQFKVVKRASPTVTTYSNVTGTPGYARDAGVSGDVPTTITAIGDSSFFWWAATGSSTPSVNLECQWTAEAEI